MIRTFLSVLLFILITNSVTGTTEIPIQPLSSSDFKPVVLPSPLSSAPTTVSTKVVEPKPSLATKVIRKPIKPAHKPKKVVTGLLLAQGKATWYCKRGVSVCHYRYPDTLRMDMYAAAGPALRHGNWRGKLVKVCNLTRLCVIVRLVDSCACFKGNKDERLIDLYHDPYFILFKNGGSTVKVYSLVKN